MSYNKPQTSARTYVRVTFEKPIAKRARVAQIAKIAPVMLFKQVMTKGSSFVFRHLQKKTHLSAVKRDIHRNLHLEVAKGFDLQNRDYCLKYLVVMDKMKSESIHWKWPYLLSTKPKFE